MKLFFTTFFCLTIFYCSAQQPVADYIFSNAKIWTGDPANAWAQAIAVSDNKILFVGKNAGKYKGPNTITTDLKGKMVVPGFIDNHTHFLGGGHQLASVNLRSVKSKDAFIATLGEYIKTDADKSWILGGDWDHEAWGGELPTKEWIDNITKEQPVLLSRYDGHMALANSAALRAAGIDINTADPAGGKIERAATTGEPTGILKDRAVDMVLRIVPQPTPKLLNSYLQRAVQEAVEHGVTQVNDMGNFGGWADLATYRTAYASHQLAIRIYSFVPIKTWATLDSFVRQNGRGDDMLRWGNLKGFVDGSLGSTTAWFYKPYLDAPNSTGLQVTDTILLRKWILEADSAGLHVTVHAIGDHANDWLLNVYAEAVQQNGSKDRRFRIEHAQHLTQLAIPRFAAQRVIPSMQPYHAIDDGKWAAKRLDSARLRGTYAFKDLLQTGAGLTFGSDWTVAPLDPIAGIYAAVTRRTLDDKNPGGWLPDQKISVEQALRCYTVNNAYAIFMENKTGMLKAGMLADMAVLSGNIFTIAPENIRDIKVLRTIVNGKEVYLRKD